MYFHATLSNSNFYVEALIEAASEEKAATTAMSYANECTDNEREAIGADAEAYAVGKLNPLVVKDGELHELYEDRLFTLNEHAHKNSHDFACDFGKAWMLKSGHNG